LQQQKLSKCRRDFQSGATHIGAGIQQEQHQVHRGYTHTSAAAASVRGIAVIPIHGLCPIAAVVGISIRNCKREIHLIAAADVL